MRTVIYPGSFDPLTNGHLDLVQRATKLFDRVIVAVARNDSKHPLFTLQERLDMVTQAVTHMPQVEADSFDGLLIEYVEHRLAEAVIRGLRAVSDFEFEFQLALMNRKLNERIETIFMMPKETYTFLSSRIVKEVASLGGTSARLCRRTCGLPWPRNSNAAPGQFERNFMALLVNLRHLDAQEQLLEGELGVAELDLDPRDDIIRIERPLRYKLEVQKLDDGLLVQGRLQLALECDCVRCLKPFSLDLVLDPWTALLPFEGDDAVPINNDCIDLTPWMREDILLEFPQHPLCNPECGGLPKTQLGKAKNTSSTGRRRADSSAWDELNKLKF